MEAFGSGALLALIIVGVLIAILWILMPFAVFGLKARIDESNKLLRGIGNEIERLRDDLKDDRRTR